MPRSKEIPEPLENNIDEVYNNDEGYNQLSTLFGVHDSIVRKIIYIRKAFAMTSSQTRSDRLRKQLQGQIDI